MENSSPIVPQLLKNPGEDSSGNHSGYRDLIGGEWFEPEEESPMLAFSGAKYLVGIAAAGVQPKH